MKCKALNNNVTVTSIATMAGQDFKPFQLPTCPSTTITNRYIRPG
jgi:hypothetical protein